MVLIPIQKVEKVNVGYAGEKHKDVVDEVNRIVKEDFKGVSVLDREMEIDSNGNVTYTPIYGTILLNQVLRERFPGSYVSTHAEKERALTNGLKGEGVYSYDSLCLGGFDLYGIDLDFAGRLVSVLREQGEKIDLEILREKIKEEPAMIGIRDLSLRPDETYGLVIVPRLDAKVYFDSRLKQEGSFNEVDFERGLPSKFGEGNRRFYPSKGKLQGVCLDDELDVDASDGDWSLSYCDSRVVVTETAEGSRVA